MNESEEKGEGSDENKTKNSTLVSLNDANKRWKLVEGSEDTQATEAREERQKLTGGSSFS